ncbi:MAG: alpha/beta fold hydrolase [Geitlerinemataceae cyanobacterium]
MTATNSTPNVQPIALSDVTLSVTTWGDPHNPPVLLLHGLGDTATVWSEFAPTLTDRFFAIAPDLRGHGDSDKPESGYGFDRLIADLEDLLARFGLDSVHAIAHSWSAKLLPIWAQRQPDRFHSLTLIDPFFIGTMPGWLRITFPLLYQVLPFVKAMGPYESRETAIAFGKEMKQYRGWSALQQRVFEASIEAKPGGSWGSKFTVAARDGIFEEVMHVAGLTEPIAIPTLFVQPESGLNRSDWQFAPYRKFLVNLDWAIVPGNHWPFLVEPEPFSGAVRSFLHRSGSYTKPRK